jgi:hypothetical protein
MSGKIGSEVAAAVVLSFAKAMASSDQPRVLANDLDAAVPGHRCRGDRYLVVVGAWRWRPGSNVCLISF